MKNFTGKYFIRVIKQLLNCSHEWAKATSYKLMWQNSWAHTKLPQVIDWTDAKQPAMSYLIWNRMSTNSHGMIPIAFR